MQKHLPTQSSGEFRNIERGVQPLATQDYAKRTRKCLSCHAHFRSREKSPNRGDSSTLGQVKHLEIMIRDCLTVPGCCCCMPLLHNHLMDLCSYVCKNTLLAAKGGCICMHLHPLNPPLQSFHTYYSPVSAVYTPMYRF